MMIVWGSGRKVTRNVLCCVVYDSRAQCLFKFIALRVFVSLDHFIPVLLASVVLGLVSSVPSHRDWLGRTSLK